MSLSPHEAQRPEVVLDDRAAEVEAVLLDRVDLVAVHFPGRGLPVPFGAQVAAVALPLVGAALGDLVDGDARRLDRDVGRGGGQLDLLVGAEVEVGGGAADRGHVGEVDAVDREDVVGAGGAADVEVRLLAALVAADVDAVGEHAGRLAQQRPGVARGRDLVEILLRERRSLVLLARVDERRLGGDADRLLQRRGHRHAHVDLGADAHADAGLLDLGEAGELGLQGVLAGIEAEEAEVAARVGRLHARRAGAGQRHRDAGQRLAALVDDRAVEVTGLELGAQPSGERDQEHQSESRGQAAARHRLPSRRRNLAQCSKSRVGERKGAGAAGNRGLPVRIGSASGWRRRGARRGSAIVAAQPARFSEARRWRCSIFRNGWRW